MNTENSEINEGLVRFDVIFYVRMKDGKSQIIINLEAQKDEPEGYHILNRAVFYGCRLISSQKERDFVKMNYNDIKRVFSIWLCMNMDENSMNYIHLTNDSLLGSYLWKGRMDLLNIVLIGIADEGLEHDNQKNLHHLMNVLFSSKLSANAKLKIMEMEYHIPLNEKIREDVDTMCNLSQGIFEKGEARGKAMGEAGIILRMYENGYSAEQIADATDKTIDEITAVIKNKESVLV